MERPEAIRWRERLVCERPSRAVLPGVAIVGVSIAAGVAANEWLIGAVSCLALLAACADAWVGCRCSLDDTGAKRHGPFRSRQLAWDRIDGFSVRCAGATMAGRGRRLSFHLDGVPEGDRLRVQRAFDHWHAWWSAGRGGQDA